MQLVFISHAHSDKTFARMLDTSLQIVGAKTFFDERDILIGQSIPERIYDGIGKATHLIYVISKKSASSKWVSEELSIAKMKEKSSKGFFILPILLDSIALPTAISHVKYADFRDWRNPESYRKAFLGILNVMGIEPITIANEELLWYAEYSNELRFCLRWITKSTWVIKGGMSAAQSVGWDLQAHYMPTKLAIEEYTLESDLKKLVSLIPKKVPENGRIASYYLSRKIRCILLIPN